jgi:hypothetical protein
MASTTELQANLNGFFKDVYAKIVKDLVPNSDILLKNVEFVEKEGQEGRLYHQPVLLALPSGLTWGLGNVTLVNSVASQMGDAQIAGSQIIGRDLIAMDVMAKAAKGGRQSFGEATAFIVKNLIKSTSKALELDLLYGGVGLGQTSVIAAGSPSATVTVCTITYGTWAPAIWSGFENAQFSFYNAGSLVSSGADAIFNLTSVNVVPASTSVGGTITVTGTATGTTALQALNGTTLDIYFYTAKGNQMTGVKGILANTGSLFNIVASDYSLWQANSYAAGSSQLTFGKMQNAISLAVSRGLDSETMTLVSPPTFANLINEQAGARIFDKSYDAKEAINGMEAITFYGPNGRNEIYCHPFVKQGEAMIIPKDEIMRVGPVEDVVMTLPGFPADMFFVMSSTFGSWELRTYANQAVIIEAPAHAVLVTGITNVA